MTIPKTCKAFVVDKAGAKGEIRDIDVPSPSYGEILIKVHACGVCHSDASAMEGHMGPLAKFPMIPGHETVGTIVAVGERENRWKVGDLVGGAWHGGHDGTCKSCNRGLFQMCDNGLVNGVNRIGGYAEYTILRAESAVRLPTDLDKAAMAPLLCAGVTTFNGIRQMNTIMGGTVAVQGLGGLGHLAVQYARKMGYRTVALSSNDSKKQFASELGATDYIDGSKEDITEALQKLGGADLVVVTAPSPKLIPPLVQGLGPLGKVLCLSPVGDVSVSTVAMIGKGTSVHGWPSGSQGDSEAAIDFAKRQGVNCLIEKFPLEKAQEALDRMLSGKVRFRSVLVMD